MPQPSPSFATVPVYGTYKTLSGAPVQGQLRFKVNTRVVSITDDVIFPAGSEWVVPIGSETGYVSIDLPAVDDPDNFPEDWDITVNEEFNAGFGVGLKYNIQPTLAMLPEGLNLRAVNAGVVPADPAPALIRGIASGVAGLDADGDVIDAAGNKVLPSEEDIAVGSALGWEIATASEYGADPTGVADATSALQACIDAAAAGNKRAYAAGTFRITDTVRITGPCDFSQAVFQWHGGSNLPAVVVGATGAVSSINNPGDMYLPKLLNARKTALGWAQTGVVGSVGFKLQRLYTCPMVTVPRVENFEVGFLGFGDTVGLSYNTIALGHLCNNKINFKLDTDGAGWANQNLFLGGRFSHNSAEGTSPISGVKHVLLTRGAGAVGAPNNNTFVGCSFETPNSVEHNLDVNEGRFNLFLACRWETTGSNGRVRWGAAAQHNRIEGGYGVEALVETVVSGAVGNEITGSRVDRRYFTTEGAVWENGSSSANPLLTLMRAGAKAAGDTADQYLSRLTADRWQQKGSHTDAHDRVRITAGKLLLGAGTADPVMGLAASATALLLQGGGGFTPATDAASDLGVVAAYRWRNLHLSGGMARGVRAVSTTGAVGANDSTILASGTITLTLPSATSYVGREYLIRNVGSGTVTLSASAGTVERPTVAPGEAIAVQSDGIDWRTVSQAAVLLAGDQSVDGVKTFSAAPVVPDGAFALGKLFGFVDGIDSVLTEGEGVSINRSGDMLVISAAATGGVGDVIFGGDAANPED